MSTSAPTEAHRIAERFFLQSRNAAWLKRVRVADVQNAAAVRELNARARAALSILSATPAASTRSPAYRLPPPSAPGMSLFAAAEARRTDQRFGTQPLDAEQLSTLLYLAGGQRQSPGADHPKRIVPSAGNLGSVTVHPIVLSVDGIAPGIYRFEPGAHALASIRTGHFGGWLRRFALLQEELAAAAVVLVLSSAVGTLTSRYGVRGARLALLDAGHVSQGAYLAAAALELAICASAGFIDDELLQALKLDAAADVVSLCLAVGRRTP